LNLKNTVATLLPQNPLEPGSIYGLAISTNIADLTGLRLQGEHEFSFETQREVARSESAQLTIFAPGSTNIPAGILSQLVNFDPTNKAAVVAFGTAGTAEAEVPVILVNESTGETSTVLSKPDGSFFGFVNAEEEDSIQAVFINLNGTRTVVAATQQKFDDGNVGLYRGGGTLEAQSEGGVLQVLIQPDAVKSRAKFKLDSLTLAQLLPLLNGTAPQGGTVLGGFEISIEGEITPGGSEVSMPFDPSKLPLGPGEKPEDGAFALAIVREVDGVTTFQVVDKMRFKEGKLFTNTEPFEGFLESAMANSPANRGPTDFSRTCCSDLPGEPSGDAHRKNSRNPSR